MADVPEGYVLGIDYGEARIGLALGHTIARLPRPLRTVASAPDVVTDIVATIRSESVVAVVVGIPRNMDGSLGLQSEVCRKFGEKLAAAADVPVSYVDETLSSVEAERRFAGLKDKSVGLDAVAAANILERYFEERQR